MGSVIHIRIAPQPALEVFRSYRIHLAALTVALALPGAGAPAKADFRRDIRPIFQEQCYVCHGPAQQLGSLRLDRRSSAFRIRSGTTIGPGNAAGSRLYLKVSGTKAGTRMPPTAPLSKEQVDLIRDWIDQGAEWPDDLSGEKPTPAPDPKAEQIMKALQLDDRPTLDRLLAGRPALNRPGMDGDTPLLYAAFYGTVDDVRRLLDTGADPNLANQFGVTPLMWTLDDVDKVRLLLDRGADMNAVSEEGRSALGIALGRRDAVPQTLLLIERGANANPPGSTGNVLRLAARDEAVLRALLRKGVPGKSLAEGLPFALNNGCDACANLLLPFADKATVNRALQLSFANVTPARVKFLLDHGADPNPASPGDAPLLSFAGAESTSADSVRLLLEHGANVQAKTNDGATALDLALRHGESPIVAILRKAGAVEGPPPTPAAKPDPAPSARAAIVRAVPLLQRSDVTFMNKSGCVSCHNNNLTAMTIATLREHEIAFDADIASSQLKAIGDYVAANRERYLQGISIPGAVDTTSYIMLGLAAESFAPNSATDAMAGYVRSAQKEDGSWPIAADRPPLESSPIEVTAVAARVLRVYAPAPHRAVAEQSVQRAAAWLRRAKPMSTEDRTFQLLGLVWTSEKSNDPAEDLRRAGAALVIEQRSDGGWGQLRALPSDAYATGQALVALKMAGVLKPEDPAYRRGVQFLLRTQLNDGSWYVRSRSMAFQPYFESGFPHGPDQFISAAATNWAVIALANAASNK